jgi:hypothetical protein
MVSRASASIKSFREKLGTRNLLLAVRLNALGLAAVIGPPLHCRTICKGQLVRRIGEHIAVSSEEANLLIKQLGHRSSPSKRGSNSPSPHTDRASRRVINRGLPLRGDQHSATGCLHTLDSDILSHEGVVRRPLDNRETTLALRA